MLRAHTIRLNPTREQEIYFRKAVGTARFVFNWALARWKDYRAARQQISMNDLKTEFNRIKGERFPWIYDVTKCVAEREFSNLGRALANYFRMKGTGMLPKGAKPRKDGEEVGFPRFKSKHEGYGSFYLANDKFRLNGHRIYIPKLGWVNMTERLRFTGKIMNATVSYRAGWWWISIGMDIPYSPSVHQGHPVGVDMGISYLAVDSDGQVFENQKHLKAALRRVKHLQRAVSRKVKGSRNRAKAALRLAKAHFKVACKRRDAIHKLTNVIARKASLIGLEDLHVKGMLANHHLAQAVSDASFAEIARQMTYKANWYGGMVQLVDPFYPSSKMCNACGAIKADLTLSERQWTCTTCGARLERDQTRPAIFVMKPSVW